MTRLTALVPGSVCAAALGRAWPQDLDSQVRCIDEGARSLRLACCCPPRFHEAPDPDTVTAGLVRTPGAVPVLGVVTGPLSELLSDIHRRGGELSGSSPIQDVQEFLDDASDAAVDRLRALSACGVRRAAVAEHATTAPRIDQDAAAEAHRPLLNAAAHLRIDLVLVASGLDDVASLGYEDWVSDWGCSPGLAFLAADAFDSAAALERELDRIRAAGDPSEAITAPLDAGVSPELVRHASRVLSGEDARP
ncbi:MAG: hypothetical protein F4Y12_03580 [Acidimicrobiaceae bacterium]|nr:hypothetical protein [Acidimicrobiaceae bacterium]MYH79058.1 hypothetical protein [Acidimicrobiaceae bacterium]MYK77960.1 hypothetical protein [Acidimicrobiaceae bacterium]